MMNYGNLFNVREVVAKLKSIPWSDGSLLVQTRKFVKLYGVTLEPFQEIYNELVAKYGKDGKLDASMKGWDKFNKEVNKAAKVEVAWEIEPFLNETYLMSIRDVGISINDLEVFEYLGIMVTEIPKPKDRKKGKKGKEILDETDT